MRRYDCVKCCDTGAVGFFRRRTCPACGGNPRSLRPPPPTRRDLPQAPPPKAIVVKAVTA